MNDLVKGIAILKNDFNQTDDQIFLILMQGIKSFKLCAEFLNDKTEMEKLENMLKALEMFKCKIVYEMGGKHENE